MRNGESGTDNLLCNQTLFFSPIKGEQKIAVLTKGQVGEHKVSKCGKDQNCCPEKLPVMLHVLLFICEPP